MSKDNDLIEFNLTPPAELETDKAETFEEFARAYNIPDGMLTEESFIELSNGKGDDEEEWELIKAVPLRASVYSNSPLVNYTLISPNNSGLRKNSLDTITIHMVVGQCSVEALGNVFKPVSRQASSTYGVGYDGRIGQYVDEANRPWTSSSAWNDNRAVTIETASDTAYPYAVTSAAYEALIKLCADICHRNGKSKMVWLGDSGTTFAHIGEDSAVMYMTLHKWFAATGCPGAYLEQRMQDIANRVNGILAGEQKNKFSDVPESASYYAPVMWAVEQGIVKGYDDGTFRPDNKCTRAQFVVMIWRMMGKPITSKHTVFKDEAFFGSAANAIQWAAAEGIIKGYASGYFGPDDFITRAQAAVIIWRLIRKPQPQGKTSSFKDVLTVMNSFKAIQYLAETGIIKGYDDGTFRPNGDCLRRHAVTFLYRLARTL